MFEEITYEELLNEKIGKEYILIDVRSPIEYEKETIPGSINIPIFSNEERESVGTTYKQVCVEEARKLGVEIVSKKLPSMYDEVLELKKTNKKLVFFCSRGGYRSSSLVSFLGSIGHKVYKLHGGYKFYRAHVTEYLPKEVEKVNFIVLYGNTGVGKTKILKSLESKGMNMVDLEGAAKHRGSTLGAVGIPKQSSQKMFESIIYDSIRNRHSDLIFIEGESRRIGRVVIPEYLFQKILESKNIKIEASMERRVGIILEDYVHRTDNDIIEALHFLRKRLGNEKIDEYIELVKSKKHNIVAEELMRNYYDPLYENNYHEYETTFVNNNTDVVADEIIEYFK